MGRVSKRKVDAQLQAHLFLLFWKSVADLKTSESAELFFKDLLSPVERLMLVKRLAIAILLTKGHTYRYIDNTLKVSFQTIMQVSYWLNHGGSGYQKVVEKIINDQQMEAFWDGLDELLLKLSRPGMVGTGRFQERQKRGKELYKRRRLREQL